MPVRVQCTTPGLEGNWVEFSDVWTRKELQDYMGLRGGEFVALWQRKVTAIHIETPAGEVITDPLELHQRLDDVDIRMLTFATDAGIDATAHLLTLGEANRRLSFAGDAAAQTTTTPAP